jgi:hypothetical protein
MKTTFRCVGPGFDFKYHSPNADGVCTRSGRCPNCGAAYPHPSDIANQRQAAEMAHLSVDELLALPARKIKGPQ